MLVGFGQIFRGFGDGSTPFFALQNHINVGKVTSTRGSMYHWLVVWNMNGFDIPFHGMSENSQLTKSIILKKMGKTGYCTTKQYYLGVLKPTIPE
jgi:hypothetical protein